MKFDPIKSEDAVGKLNITTDCFKDETRLLALLDKLGNIKKYKGKISMDYQNHKLFPLYKLIFLVSKDYRDINKYVLRYERLLKLMNHVDCIRISDDDDDIPDIKADKLIFIHGIPLVTKSFFETHFLAILDGRVAETWRKSLNI